MAKAKDKKGSGKAKKSTGTKLAKSAKKSGLMDLINSNLGREILADALIAAAGAAAAALTRTRPAKQAGAAVANAGSQAAGATGDAMQTAAGAVAGVVTEAARQFLPAGLLSEADGADKDGKPSPKKIKYAHRSSGHSTSKRSKKDEKGTKAEKR